MVIFGPPAVGKMTVGRAVCERTDFRLRLDSDAAAERIVAWLGAN